VPRVVYVARHGETDWNVAGRWQGHTDVPLNETGRKQARALAGRLRGRGVVGVVTSDLVRAEETGSIVAFALGVPLAYMDPRLRERTFGVFEGLTRVECETLHPDAWRGWIEERRAPEGGETQETLATRMLAAIARVAGDVATDEGAALVITHGGSVRALLAAATGTMPPLVGNGALWRLVWDARIVEATEVG